MSHVETCLTDRPVLAATSVLVMPAIEDLSAIMSARAARPVFEVTMISMPNEIMTVFGIYVKEMRGKEERCGMDIHV